MADFFVDLLLIHGPCGAPYEEPATDEELEVEWRARRERLLAEQEAHSPGTRPWAYWAFDTPHKTTKEVDHAK
jgi:hypothetical protein